MTPLEHIDYSNSSESIEPKNKNKNSILFSLWLLLSTIDHKMIEIEYCYFKKKWLFLWIYQWVCGILFLIFFSFTEKNINK